MIGAPRRFHWAPPNSRCPHWTRSVASEHKVVAVYARPPRPAGRAPRSAPRAIAPHWPDCARRLLAHPGDFGSINRRQVFIMPWPADRFLRPPMILPRVISPAPPAGSLRTLLSELTTRPATRARASIDSEKVNRAIVSIASNTSLVVFSSHYLASRRRR